MQLTRPLLFNDLVPLSKRRYQFSTLVDCYLGEILKAISDATVIHFDCHGFRDHPARLQTTALTNDKYLQLTLDAVEGKSLCLQRGCLVFANACESNAPSFGLGEARSFGWAFYTKGAGAFIGTLGTVPSKAAFAFVDRFYRALAGQAFGDVGLAFQLAHNDGEMPVRLMYCIYGNPSVLPKFIMRIP